MNALSLFIISLYFFRLFVLAMRTINKLAFTPSVRYKRSMVEVHPSSNQHKTAVTIEMNIRSSCFRKDVEHAKSVKKQIYINGFMTLYWLEIC